MKKIVAILLVLCLCPLGVWAEAEADYAELVHTIYEANTLDSLFSRHGSVQFLMSDTDAPDGYDLIWETKEVYYQSYADWFAHWEKDQVYCELIYYGEEDSYTLVAGYDHARYYHAYCFASSEAEIVDTEHETPVGCTEQDGRLILTVQYDAERSQRAMESMGLEYAGQTVMARLTVDAETYEIEDFCRYFAADGKEQVIYSCRIAYDRPEPVASRTLRAVIERDYVKTMDVTYVVDPGTDHEAVKTITLPLNTSCDSICSSPTVYFYDLEQTRCTGWDRMSDLTVYIYTDPDEALNQRFDAAYDAALPQG